MKLRINLGQELTLMIVFDPQYDIGVIHQSSIKMKLLLMKTILLE